MLELSSSNRETFGKTIYMIKPFRHCKISDTKKLKWKSSFRKSGADFQR